ncbi:MAG: ExbD/TolR family protein [bacterium]
MFKPSHKKKTSINIIPMIDVIFFLLVFFMLFTSFRTNPYGMEMNLPEAVTSTEESKENTVINISEDGDFYLNDEEMSVSEIAATTRNLFDKEESEAVIINADRDSRYNSIIQLMDSLREVGIYDIFLAAEKKD